ncbi:hypothetical protein HMPREF1484_00208 [Dermabacter sp. HFH0086]|uniref:hypothetical protein n=1 Tax=Dermabacter TaxID=36739 RepID=UPI00035434B8|nr:MULTISPECIES: hypothetical protein [Dermabacter]EPH17523.1 hypothetical protein HMPREF1484_00208 [Dermabacter sp. HFH0086]
MTASTDHIARRVMADIKSKGLSISAVADATGIAKTTLLRRLKDGDFTASQTKKIALELGSDAADYYREEAA